MAGERKIRISDVRTVGVPATDQDRAQEVYVDKLGFEKAPGRGFRVRCPLLRAGSSQQRSRPRAAAKA